METLLTDKQTNDSLPGNQPSIKENGMPKKASEAVTKLRNELKNKATNEATAKEVIDAFAESHKLEPSVKSQLKKWLFTEKGWTVPTKGKRKGKGLRSVADIDNAIKQVRERADAEIAKLNERKKEIKIEEDLAAEHQKALDKLEADFEAKKQKLLNK